jgi:hypothetical protein
MQDGVVFCSGVNLPERAVFPNLHQGPVEVVVQRRLRPRFRLRRRCYRSPVPFNECAWVRSVDRQDDAEAVAATLPAVQASCQKAVGQEAEQALDDIGSRRGVSYTPVRVRRGSSNTTLFETLTSANDLSGLE